MKRLFIIAGPNGAGKTTASFTILPDLLDCREFVNADEIARGLSPLDPDGAAFAAGRIMLERIDELMHAGEDFAFETTLSSRSPLNILRQAQELGYVVTMVFFHLSSVALAKSRVQTRVREGGHNIPPDVIDRRYERGLRNFFDVYRNNVNDHILIENSGKPYQIEEMSRHDDTFRSQLQKGLEKAYAKMIKEKRATNSPLVVWQDGKVVKLDPHKVPSTTTYR